MNPAFEAVRPATFKSTAWNGIQCSLPADWVPGRIGLRHLVIQSEAGPAMEIKWGPVKGRFSSRNYLKRLSRSIARQGGRFRERPLPEEWRKALRQVETAGFLWETGHEGAVGVVAFCPLCRTASLVQFFQSDRSPVAEQQAAAVLATFQDHRTDERTAWQLYDISALLPDAFTLKRHRFETGRFVMEFSDGRRNLIFYRWGPARVLLRDRSLAMMAETVSAGAGAGSRPCTVAGYPGVAYHDPLPCGLGRRLKAYVGISHFCGVRLWHVESRNRILGAVMQSRHPIEPVLLDALCDGYGMSDEDLEGTQADPE
jgi:hypothetical protein